MPKLAAGSKGHVFSFWNYNESVEHSGSHMYTHKLEEAAIHSLVDELSGGFVNYELEQKPSSLLVHL